MTATAVHPGILNRLGALLARRRSRTVGDAAILGADGTLTPLRSLYANTNNFGRELLAGLGSDYDYADATVANAFAVSVTAWACANVRSSRVASIPLMVTDAADQPVERTPAEWFIKRQARLMSRISFHLSIFGRFYLRKRRLSNGIPAELELLNPLDVHPNVDLQSGKATSYQVIGRRDLVKTCDMITDTTFNPLSDVDGVSAYEVAMRQIFADAQLIRYAGAFFANGARIDGMLFYEGSMDEEDYKVNQQRFKEFKGALNAFKNFIFSGLSKWTYTPMTHAPADLAMPDLKNLLRSDTCAAFRVNPVLIGIGTANDPLSALGTYQEIKRNFTEDEAIPESDLVCAALTEQWLQPDFKMWGNLKIVPDLKEFMGATSATQERSTTAVGNVTGGIWSVNEGRKYTGQDEWQGHLDRDPVKPLALWTAGVWKRNRLLVAIGDRPDPSEPDGYIYEVDPRAKAPPQAQPMAFNFQPHPTPPTLPTAAPEPQRAIEATIPAEEKTITIPVAARSEGSCYVILSLANDPMITVIQEQLRADRPEIEWEDPNDFHVTLIAAMTAPNLDLLKNVLPKSINPFRVNTGAVGTFESEGKIPVFLEVAPDPALVALQSGLAGAFTALGASLSEYSDPAHWHPHVTLGYMQPAEIAPAYNSATSVMSATIICSIEQGDEFETIYVTRSKEDITLQVAELDNWSRKVKHKGPAVAFEEKHLPQMVTAFVRANLADGWNPSAVFVEAKAAIRAGIEPKIGATPEDAQEFWRDFDALQHSLGDAWLDYQRAVSHEIFDAVSRGDVTDALDKAMASHHAALVDKWVGTAEQPGDLYKIMLAGMQAGQRSLEKETAANPQKPRAGLPISISWDLASSQALDFIRSYAFDLIRNIDDTTRANIRAAVEKYTAEGLDADWLREQIAQYLVPPGGNITDAIRARAGVIGQNESMVAYNSGALKRWEDAGVNEGTWQTVNDGKVCAICRRLAGQVASIRSGWTDPATGQTYRVQAHIGDRCFRKPKVA